ncbi:MAG: TRAP transporter small permease, partial [Bacillota bacterium]|nr:TRAP transporter small permease [Bacillota bacterium]
GRIAGIGMLFGVSLVLAEVIARSVFDETLYITQEYTAYLMVAITFLGLAYALKEGTHIRMAFLHKILKGRSIIFLDIYALTIGLVIFILITVSTANFFWDSVISQSRSMHVSKTYLAIPQFFMPLGSFVMVLQFTAEILRSILKLRTGEADKGGQVS